jgi:hypothetical protein
MAVGGQAHTRCGGSGDDLVILNVKHFVHTLQSEEKYGSGEYQPKWIY